MHGEKRLLIVARRFWPCTNDSALRLRRITETLVREGWQITVLTPRWHSNWPTRVTLNGTSVVRVDAPPVTALRQIRYQQHLKQWAAQNANSFDVVYCDQADWDADAVLSCLNSSSQVKLVRLDIGELETCCADTIHRACSRASRVLVLSQLAHQRAVAMGLANSQLLRVWDWSVPRIDRSHAACREARQILSETNGDLFLSRGERVIVVPGELSSRWRIELIIRSMGAFLERQPGIRLWILGGNAERKFALDAIVDMLRDFGIHRIVSLPGTFTSIDTVLQAADCCLFPGRGCGCDYLIPTCVASGIPILAARTSELDSQLGPAASNMCFEPESASDLLQKVRHWWERPSEFSEAAQSALRFSRRQLSTATPDTIQALRMHVAGHSLSDIPNVSAHDRLRPAQ